MDKPKMPEKMCQLIQPVYEVGKVVFLEADSKIYVCWCRKVCTIQRPPDKFKCMLTEKRLKLNESTVIQSSKAIKHEIVLRGV